MPKIQGTIKYMKKDNRGFKLSEDDNWYSMYRGSLPVKVNTGDKVEVDYQLNGEYRNIKELKVLSTSNVSKSSNKSSYGIAPEIAIMNSATAMCCKFIDMQTELRKVGKEVPDADINAFMDLVTVNLVKNYLIVKDTIYAEKPIVAPVVEETASEVVEDY
jgi:hypothetical protein